MLLGFSTTYVDVNRLMIVGGGSILGIFFWIRVVFPLVIYPGILVSLMHLYSLRASPPWIEVKFLNQNPYIPSWTSDFQFSTFFSVDLSDSRCIPASGFLWSLYNSAFSFMLFLFLYFTPKLFCFLCIRLLVEFSFVILECPVLIISLDPVSVYFKSPFCQYLLIYLFKLPYKICQLF